MTLQNKVALVTGSTSGIGLGIAEALAADGAAIMLNGFGDAAKIEEIRLSIEQRFGVKARYNGADIGKADQIAAMVAETQKSLGSLDILVNNAGIQFTAPVEEFPEDKWDQIVAINMSGVFHGMKAAIPGMKERKSGSIVIVSSISGWMAGGGSPAYYVAKAAEIMYARTLARDLAPFGIRANTISPGSITAR